MTVAADTPQGAVQESVTVTPLANLAQLDFVQVLLWEPTP